MSQTIKNPYKFEGLCYSLRGLILTTLGAVLMFLVRDKVTLVSKTIAGFIFVGGILLLLLGIAALIKGLLRMLRFYVGKNIPRDLLFGYKDKNKRYMELKEMLLKGINPTFYEPEKYSTQHVLESIIPRLTETPPYIRYIGLLIFEQSLRSIALYVFFGIAVFSGISGLTNFTNSSVLYWLGWLLVIQQFVTWSNTFITFSFRRLIIPTSYNNIYKILVKPIAAAILLPSIMLPIDAKFPLPVLKDILPFPFLIIEVILILLLCTGALLLIITRIPRQEPEALISSKFPNRIANIHPSDLFSHLESMIGQRSGHNKYIEERPELIAEGSLNKGKFSGSVLYETPQNPIQNDQSRWRKAVLMFSTSVGHMLFTGAGVWIFYYLISLKTIVPEELFINFFLTFMTWNLTSILISITYLFWSEFHYESDIIYLLTDGSYSEYQRKAGTASDDSFTDISTTVRSNINLRLYVTKIKSTTFKLKGPRYVTEMSHNDLFLDNIMKSFDDFIANRPLFDIYSPKDLVTASKINEMNQIVYDEKKNHYHDI